ncbi:MAG TPA: GIY-YIG nuclease family protein, partial [Burkholderiales bacterium]|nr:GIY-YIG nuclease family protein [Burkholderiales bacterium]
ADGEWRMANGECPPYYLEGMPRLRCRAAPTLKKRKARPAWTVYIVRCADGSLYTGITRDVARRIEEHNSNGLLAARYTRARRPVVLVYREKAATRSAACRREYRIKQMKRGEKQKLVTADCA